MEKNTSKAVGLSFNAAATAAFVAKHGSSNRFRVQVKDGTLFIRPTDRVKGPHVFADFNQAPVAGSGIKVQLNEEQMEKLAIDLEQGKKFGVQEDKYGWFFLTTDESGIDGAKATVIKATPVPASAHVAATPEGTKEASKEAEAA